MGRVGAAARTRCRERAEKLITRTGESAAEAGASRPKRFSRTSSRSSTWPAQRVGCLVSMASSTRRPASATSSSSRSRVSTEVCSAVSGQLLPVGGLVAVLPGTEVQGGEFGELQGGDGAAAVGRTVDPAVVHAHEVAVGGQAHIALEGVRTVLDRLPVRGQCVLRRLLGGSAVGDHLDRVLLSCEGHRVMVPPSRGRRETEGVTLPPFSCRWSVVKSRPGRTATAYGALTPGGKS